MKHLVEFRGSVGSEPQSFEDRGEFWLMVPQTGPAASDVVPYIIAKLTCRNSRIRYEAALSLAEIGPEAIGAKPMLIKLLGDDDPAVGIAAALALYRIDPLSAD